MACEAEQSLCLGRRQILQGCHQIMGAWETLEYEPKLKQSIGIGREDEAELCRG
jgi:hypothetical protein